MRTSAVKLLQITNLTPEAAKELLLQRVEEECRHEAGALIQKITEEAQEEAKDKSREIILQAIQRYAAEQTCDHTVSTVEIPSDDMKGRVIGREGRNIRSFEKATGVDVIIDDTPGVVVVSCFDPVRREIARLSLDRLIQDGRIHPARIEEVVVQATKEMDEDLIRLGREAVQEANVPNLAKAVVPMLGRLAYRTSYGQNVLRHSIEVAYLCQVIADELGLDARWLGGRGLLHDIGKAMDHEQEGGHPQIGKEFLRQVQRAGGGAQRAEAHHGDVPGDDAVHADRDGGGRDQRQPAGRSARKSGALHQAIAGPGRAGQDVRGGAAGVRDPGGARGARDGGCQVGGRPGVGEDRTRHCEEDRETMTYPGEIKVTLIREVRAVEYAR